VGVRASGSASGSFSELQVAVEIYLNVQKLARISRQLRTDSPNFSGVLRHECLDAAFEVLTRNQIDGLHAIGKEPEQQAPVLSDAVAHNAGASLEANRAYKSARVSGGNLTESGDGAHRNVVGRMVQPLLKIASKLDNADGLSSESFRLEQQFLFAIGFRIGGGVNGAGRLLQLLVLEMDLLHLAAQAVLRSVRSPQLFLEVNDLSLLSGFVRGCLADGGAGGGRLGLSSFEALHFFAAAFEFFTQFAGFASLGVELLPNVAVRLGGVLCLDIPDGQ